jgi:DNA-binding response OmpR family regulator
MDGMEIILIEDDEDVAIPMLKFLRAHFNSQVRYIQDGERAAEYLIFEHDTSPKLILLDTTLPHMDGIELFRMICLEPANRKLMIFFLVDDDASKQHIESLGLKPHGYLRKPDRKMTTWEPGADFIRSFVDEPQCQAAEIYQEE